MIYGLLGFKEAAGYSGEMGQKGYAPHYTGPNWFCSVSRPRCRSRCPAFLFACQLPVLPRERGVAYGAQEKDP